MLQRRLGNAALAGDLDPACDGVLRVPERTHRVLVVGVHPKLAAGSLHDRRSLSVVVGVGMGASDEADVLEPIAERLGADGLDVDGEVGKLGHRPAPSAHALQCGTPGQGSGRRSRHSPGRTRSPRPISRCLGMAPTILGGVRSAL